MPTSAKNVLLTGLPSCGKTTVVRRVIERLPGLGIAGFYTEEIRREGQRLGFNAIGLSGEKMTLAHVAVKTGTRVGRYGVDVAKFEAFLENELSAALAPSARRQPAEAAAVSGHGTPDLVVIDEIGKMECFSKRFVEIVRRLLDGPLPVLATVGQRGGGFLAEVKRRRDILLITVVRDNRDALPEQLAAHLRKIIASDGPENGAPHGQT